MMAAAGGGQRQTPSSRGVVSGGSAAAAAALPGGFGAVGGGADAMKAQLTSLLRRRDAEDSQSALVRKTEVAEGLFRAERVTSLKLQAEVGNPNFTSSF